jgi:hypothetical protein
VAAVSTGEKQLCKLEKPSDVSLLRCKKPYVMKNDSKEELAKAIRLFVNGDALKCYNRHNELVNFFESLKLD